MKHFPYLILLILALTLAAACGEGDSSSPAGGADSGSGGEGGGGGEAEMEGSAGTGLEEKYDEKDAGAPEPGRETDASDEGSSGDFYPPMLSDPALLPIVFGEDMESINLDFGDVSEGSFTPELPYEAYTFDSLAGARVTISLDSLDQDAQPVVLLYGPRRPTGLWGEAIAVNSDFGNTYSVIINDFRLPEAGYYLILATTLEYEHDGRYRLSFGCRNQCREPSCPDLTCQQFCADGFLPDANGCLSCFCRKHGDCSCRSDKDCPKNHFCEDCECVPEGSPVGPGGGPGWDCECPPEYDPVCGIDGITYVNPCEAECAGIYEWSEGDCETQVIEGECFFDSDCPPEMACVNGECVEGRDCGCPEYFEPVCGVDGRTYTNTCEAMCFGVKILHSGPCMPPPDGECRPVCKQIFNGTAWVDPCTMEVIDYQQCSDCEALCMYANTRSEGWYSSCGWILIAYADCAVGCGCPEVWEPVCGVDGVTYSNECEAGCAGVETAYYGECRNDVNGCFGDDDCPPGQQCVFDDESCGDPEDPLADPSVCFGVCAWPSGAPECISDEDCPPGWVCTPTESGSICLDPSESECVITGCNMELCKEFPTGSDCSWRPEYACLMFASCERLDNGLCGWRPFSEEYDECLLGYTDGDHCVIDSDCPPGQYCDIDICVESDCVCPPEQAPVCGSDGQTYPNACEANCAGTSILHDGPC